MANVVQFPKTRSRSGKKNQLVKVAKAPIQPERRFRQFPDGQRATATSHIGLQGLLLKQLAAVLRFEGGLTQTERDDALVASLTLLEELAPKDTAESMLAVQMTATHQVAMNCLRRAQRDGQSIEARDYNLKHAAKLMAVYARQVEVLDKHRGKGQQNVVVEHVSVAAGGQAIVGAVTRNVPPPEAAQGPRLIGAPSPELVFDKGAHRAIEPARIERRQSA